MISAVDFEDIFGWGPARARTGLPTPPAQPAALVQVEPRSFEALPAVAYTIRELRPRAERGDVRIREFASV